MAVLQRPDIGSPYLELDHRVRLCAGWRRVSAARVQALCCVCCAGNRAGLRFARASVVGAKSGVSPRPAFLAFSLAPFTRAVWAPIPRAGGSLQGPVTNQLGPALSDRDSAPFENRSCLRPQRGVAPSLRVAVVFCPSFFPLMRRSCRSALSPPGESCIITLFPDSPHTSRQPPLSAAADSLPPAIHATHA